MVDFSDNEETKALFSRVECRNCEKLIDRTPKWFSLFCLNLNAIEKLFLKQINEEIKAVRKIRSVVVLNIKLKLGNFSIIDLIFEIY